jgi:hypothetical protein
MSFALGLGCDCCEPDSCRVRLNVLMSDSQSMLDSGVTVTVVIKEGGTTVATFGPDSPDLSAIQYALELDASTSYTAELTVEQDGGSTCAFTRAFSTPAVCNPFSLSLFIPRVWVQFLACGGVVRTCYPYPCDMAISVDGPSGFTFSGNTGPAPVTFQPDPCYMKFTPCSAGDYDFTGTSAASGTTTPGATLNLPVVGISTFLWQKIGYGGPGEGVYPTAGHTWPAGFCQDPISSTLSISSTRFGSGAVGAVDDGECGGGFTGGTSGTLPACDGGTASVSVDWSVQLGGRYDPSTNTTDWYVSASGLVRYVCLCPITDTYGVCRWTVVGGGTGEAYIYGETIVGTTAGFALFCSDCDSLDVSISVGPVTNPSTLPRCGDAVPCGGLVNAINLTGTVTVTV